MTVENGGRPRPATSGFRRKFTALAEYEAFLANVFDPFKFSPNRARFNVKFVLLALGDLRIWNVNNESGYKIVSGSPPPSYWICMPTSGHIECFSGSTNKRLSPGQGWIFDAQAVDATRESPGLQKMSFDLPRALVHEHLVRTLELEPTPADLSGCMLDLSHGNGRLILDLISGMVRSIDTARDLTFSQFAAQNFSNLILDLLVHGSVPTPSTGMQHVHSLTIRRAVDFIEANLQQSLSIIDIAEAAGVGPRALQISFQKRFNCSPLRYLRQQRLERVRHDLINSSDNESVADIAARWGFFHLGLFARQYREVYGELPSVTKLR